MLYLYLYLMASAGVSVIRWFTLCIHIGCVNYVLLLHACITRRKRKCKHQHPIASATQFLSIYIRFIIIHHYIPL